MSVSIQLLHPSATALWMELVNYRLREDTVLGQLTSSAMVSIARARRQRPYRLDLV